MSKEQPEILGKNWTKEVGSWKVETNIRNEFYQKAAGLKLDVDTGLDELVKHPESKGLKTQEEINKEKDFKYRVKEGGNERLYNILDKYFKGMKIEPKDREKEVALSLYCLTKQAVNVDLVVPSWKVEIKSGQLFITKSTGKIAVNGAFLRTIPSVTDREGWSDPIGLPLGYKKKSPEDGWTPIPPIPGLPPKIKTKPKKAKTESKASDILETL